MSPSAGPSQAGLVPSGDRLRYSADEGHSIRPSAGPSQAGLVPSGERRRESIPQLLGECPPERQLACKPAGRLRYTAAEGQVS